MEVKRAEELLERATDEIKIRDEAGNERDHHEIGRESLAKTTACEEIVGRAVPAFAVLTDMAEALEASLDSRSFQHNKACRPDTRDRCFRCETLIAARKALVTWRAL